MVDVLRSRGREPNKFSIIFHVRFNLIYSLDIDLYPSSPYLKLIVCIILIPFKLYSVQPISHCMLICVYIVLFLFKLNYEQ